MSKVNPFKKKNRIGQPKWYEKISFSYSGNLKNSITAKEKDLLNKSLVKDWQNGIRHSIPITLPSFNLLKYINLSPSFNYSERWYTSYINKRYDPQNAFIPPLKQHVLTDTVYAFRRNYDYSYSLSTSTNIYGMYIMRNPNSRIKSIRHKITPSLSFNYTPDFGQKKFKFWDSYFDGTGKEIYYNHFEGATFGSAGRGANGGINFSLSNNLEAKVLEVVKDSVATKDEKPKYRKVKIIDNLGMSTSYNMIADSFRLSPIALNARTTIKGISINMGANLNPYMVDSKGRVHDEYTWSHKSGFGKLGRVTNANMSFGMNFDSKKEKKETEGKKKRSEEEKQVDDGEIPYTPFNMPWSFRFDYSFYYTNTYRPDKNGKIKGTINQSLNLGGRLSVTDKWQMDMNTNFDIQAMKFSFTTVNVSRTLHCWSMSFSFVPFGDRKSYSFNLAASSALLKDLKINKQSTWRDN